MSNPAVNHSFPASSSWVKLGKVTAAFGIRGWVKVHSYTDPEAGLFDYPELKLQRADGTIVRVEIAEFKPHKKGFIAKFKGIDDRNQAELLQHADFVVKRDELPEIDDDEYYWEDLISLTVINKAGDSLGTVSHLFETGANDVLVVKGDRERLIPFVLDAVILTIDFKKETIIVDWDKDF